MRLTGFILAGGRSSRMGREKAWLPVGSQTLIEAVIERIRPLVEQVVVIGNSRNSPRLQERLAHRVLTDLTSDDGPLMGLYTGLMHTETALNLFVPCDMPWVERRLVERLMRACRDGAEVAASLHPLEGMQPFPLVCHTTARRTIGALLGTAERSLHALLRQPNAVLVNIQDPEWWRSFTNVNTIADHATLSRELTLAR